MPFSDQTNQPWVINSLKPLGISSMLDVGAGWGTHGRAFSQYFPNVKRHAIEIWKPYIYEYDLFMFYSAIFNVDVRHHDDFNYDVVIFGDILEHLSKEDAVAVWEKVAAQAKYALIGIPIVHYPQGEHFGNPYEAHVKDDWTHDEVLETFSGITSHATSNIVGTYLAKFV